MKTILPEGWSRPKGYANGILAEGKTLFIAGQIGWNEKEQFESDDFVAQVEQALKNIVAVLEAGGGKPEHIARLTWYVTDKKEYLARLQEIGVVYRGVLGAAFPTMSLVQVVALVEDRAKVEIEATAIIP
ncbi:MAG: RidA family protein [Rhodoblastus sp.]